MKRHSRRVFQLSALAGLIILLLSMAMMFFEWPPQPEAIADALDWNHYGARAPYPVLVAVWWSSMVVLMVGGIGFVLLRNWARYALAALILALIALTPFQGLYVNTALNEFMFLLGNALIVVPLILSFSPPYNAYFTKTTECY